MILNDYFAIFIHINIQSVSLCAIGFDSAPLFVCKTSIHIFHILGNNINFLQNDSHIKADYLLYLSFIFDEVAHADSFSMLTVLFYDEIHYNYHRNSSFIIYNIK